MTIRSGERVAAATRSRWTTALAILAMLSACSTPAPPPSAFEQAFDDETKSWQEVSTQLPPAPQERHLVVFGVGGATQFRFAIDAYTLSIGSDGVYRYTLVATSPAGARNVSYEGIRCESAQKKIYATGRPDGTWVRSRNAAWTPIEEVGINRQHAALMKEYFCVDGYPSRRISDVLARLRVTLPSTIL